MNTKIGFDIRMIRSTGIGTYIQGLLSGFQKNGISSGLDLCLFGNQTLPSFAGLPSKNFGSKIYSIFEQIEYPFRMSNCALWHAPHYNVPILKGKTKLVVTIHDLIHWIFRKDFFTPLQGFYAEKMLTQAVKNAEHIITVSQKTKDDLVYHFEADPEKVSVIYEAVEDSFQPVNEPAIIKSVKAKYGLPDHFFFYLGMIKPHKNVAWLIRLFSKIKKEGKTDASLVLVGKKDPKYTEAIELLSRQDPKSGIIHIPYVDSQDLPALYSASLALVHPSLYEGFGLTLLEAMACGTAVIAFRAASVPEVVGDAACLADPCVEAEMTSAILRVEKSPSYREELIRRGRQRVARFSWKETAEKTRDIYEKVLCS